MNNIYNITPFDGAYIRVDKDNLTKILNVFKKESIDFKVFESFIEIIINEEVEDILKTISSTRTINNKKLDYEDILKYKDDIIKKIRSALDELYYKNPININLNICKDIYLKTTKFIYQLYDKR